MHLPRLAQHLAVTSSRTSQVGARRYQAVDRPQSSCSEAGVIPYQQAWGSSMGCVMCRGKGAEEESLVSARPGVEASVVDWIDSVTTGQVICAFRD